MKPRAAHEDTARMREFVDAVRACLGKDPLYGTDQRRNDTERFYVRPHQLPLSG